MEIVDLPLIWLDFRVRRFGEVYISGEGVERECVCVWKRVFSGKRKGNNVYQI